MIIKEDTKELVRNHCSVLADRIIRAIETCENTEDLTVKELDFDVDVSVKSDTKLSSVSVTFTVK